MSLLPSFTHAAAPAKFFEAHCVSCHDADTKKGDLDLTSLPFTPSDPENVAKWVKIHDRIDSGEMPPKNKTRPPAADVRETTKSLHDDLVAAERKASATDGKTRLRRTTRAEYENTIRDLFDLELAPDFKLIEVNFDDAEITIEFSPAKLAPGQKPERVTEIASDKLRAVTHHTFSLKPRRTIARDKLEQITIPAYGCDCKACNLAAYEAVANVEGVYQATASFKEGKITAFIDPSVTNKAALEAALKKRGVVLEKPKP